MKIESTIVQSICILKQKRTLARAVVCLFSAQLLLAGCDGSGGDSTTGKPVANVGMLELAPNTKLIPSDGSVVATAFGQAGVEYSGLNLSNVDIGDYIIAVTPVTDSARERLHHVGGYVKLATGYALVPRAEIDESYLAPGNANYSHFLVHTGKVLRRVINPGPFANAGAQAFQSAAQKDSPLQAQGFLSFVTDAFSAVAGGVVNIVSNVVGAIAGSSAKSVVQAAGAIATATVAATATTLGTVVANTVSGSKGVSESAIASAITNSLAATTGRLGDVAPEGSTTTIESSGVETSEIIKSLKVSVSNLGHTPTFIAGDIGAFDGFTTSGAFTSTIDSSGTVLVELRDYQVSSQDGARSAVLNGRVLITVDSDLSLDIQDFTLDTLASNLSARLKSDVDVTAVRGSGTLPLRRIKLTPVVVNATVPLVVVPELELSVVIDGKDTVSKMDGTVTANVSGTSPQAIASTGTDSVSRETASEALKITSRVKLFDTAGTFIEVGEDSIAGTNLDQLGYEGWSHSAVVPKAE